MENQINKKEEIQNKEEVEEFKPELGIRISTPDRPEMLPRIEYAFIKDLFNMLPEHVKKSEEKNIELEESLKKFGYNPDEFSFIKIKSWDTQNLSVVDGRKRILILYKINPNKRFEIVHLKPLRKKVPNLALKKKNEKLLAKKRSGRKNNNSETGN